MAASDVVGIRLLITDTAWMITPFHLLTCPASLRSPGEVPTTLLRVEGMSTNLSTLFGKRNKEICLHGADYRQKSHTPIDRVHRERTQSVGHRPEHSDPNSVVA